MKPDTFPDDENGEVLRSMAERGVDLTVSRQIDFAHLMPDQDAAEAFAKRAESMGFEVAIYEADEEAIEDGVTDWDVVCTREMIPSHMNISQTEAVLGSMARELGGHEDGWGFMDE